MKALRWVVAAGFAFLVALGGFAIHYLPSTGSARIEPPEFPWQPWWNLAVWLVIMQSIASRVFPILQLRIGCAVSARDHARLIGRAKRHLLLKIGEVCLASFLGVLGLVVLLAAAGVAAERKLGWNPEHHQALGRFVLLATCCGGFAIVAAFAAWLEFEESRLRWLYDSSVLRSKVSLVQRAG